jgi:hypothetical protein
MNVERRLWIEANESDKKKIYAGRTWLKGSEEYGRRRRSVFRKTAV